ncbi:MAG: response regulator [Candidatus Omnitrophota bacterium]
MAKPSILLVDDEHDFLELMATRIKSWGYGAITASNGKDALGIMQTKKPDIVILDYMMPEMDGIKTLKEIRKISASIPVVMMTAYPDERSIKGAEQLGVSTYIPKMSMYSDMQSVLKSTLHMIEEKLSSGKR